MIAISKNIKYLVLSKMNYEIYKQSSNLTFESTTYAHANTLQVSKLYKVYIQN